MIYVAFSTVILLLYALIQLFFSKIWSDQDPVNNNNSEPLKSTLAILVPVRNEAAYIVDCVQALLRQDYPESLLKIYILDNHSSDQTASLVSKISDDRVQLIRLSENLKEEETFKKEALAFGIQLTEAEWILTTDGDCQAPPQWASSMMQHALAGSYEMVLGSVKICAKSTFLENYQSLDTAGLMLVSSAGLKSGLLISGNGANFLFSKRVFHHLGGYTKNQSIRSGDDLFLLQNLYQVSADKIGYLKHLKATVRTQAEQTWRSFFQQRRRWASKSRHLPHAPTRYISILVFLNSCFLISHLILALIFGPLMIAIFAVHFALKALVDIYLLRRAAYFFELSFPISHWILSTLFNPLYIVLVGMTSLIGIRPTWKKRKI